MNACRFVSLSCHAFLLSLLLSFFMPVCSGAEKTETYGDGTIKTRFKVADDGRKHGACQEYFENGKIRVRASYRNGELDGSYKSYHENGKICITAKYSKGVLHGKYLEKDEKGKILVKGEYAEGNKNGRRSEYVDGALIRDEVWAEGVLTHPKSEEMIQKTLAEIYKTSTRKKSRKSRNSKKKEEEPAAGAFSAAHIGALRRLQAYRYLCDIPWEDLRLDNELNSYAAAGAAICDKIGRLDHHPKNPGMPEEAYRKAYHATSHSNLSMGTVFARSVDAFMFDSDKSNIDRVGHRRWCLNPKMLKVGFGASGRFGAQMAHDKSRTEVPDYDYVCYPPRGYLPTGYISVHHAWSVSLNPGKYQAPDKGSVKVRVIPRMKRKKKSRKKKSAAAEALEMEYFNVDKGGFGIKWCIIFRCKGMSVSPGASYDVVVEGVKDRNGKDAPIKYMVEFIDSK